MSEEVTPPILTLAELQEAAGQLAVAQVQLAVAMGQIRQKLFGITGGLLGVVAIDPASDIEAAFQNANAAAKRLLGE